MKAILKSKLFTMFAALLMALCCVFGVIALGNKKTARADETVSTPTVEIVSNNLSYSESIYILYAVNSDGFDRNEYQVKMLFWEESQDEYVLGTEKYVALAQGSANVKGNSSLIFYSDGIAAKEMTTDIFARPYVEIDGEEYYGDVMKFSVLEYVYTMEEKGGLSEDQQNMFDAMLEYGAAAQILFGYKTDRLANEKFYKVNVENGTLADGFTFGRFSHGETASLKAAATDESGNPFLFWQDIKGNVVSENAICDVTVTGDATYTAVYTNTYGVVYTLSSDGTYAMVTGYTGTASEVVIASKYEGVPVTKIGDWAFCGCDNLTEIVIPASVTTIGMEAFSGCDNLTSVVFEENSQLTSIGNYAFNECDNLTEIVIPANVTSIGENAFAYSDNLTSVVFEENSQLTSIGNHAFYYCDNLTEIVIPESVTSIDYWAFAYCDNLTSVVFEENSQLTSIGGYAFYGCSKLTEIVIPASVTSIGEGAFEYCDKLTIYCEAESQPSGWDVNWNYSDCPVVWGHKAPTEGVVYTLSDDGTYAIVTGYTGTASEVVIADTYQGVPVTEIGDWAFETPGYPYFSLTGLVIPDSVTKIGDSAFYRNYRLTELVLSNNLTHIGASAFESCASVTEIVIPAGVTYIGDFAFYNCQQANIVLAKNSQLITIGDSAFSCCYALTEFAIPTTVTSIGDGVFSGCSRLTEIIIPATVTSIGDGAFSGCSRLTEIIIPATVTSIGASAFNGCTSLTIYCEAESKPSGWSLSWNSSNCPVVWGYGVDKDYIVLTDEITFETYNNTTISLPASVEGTINKVIVGAHVVFDAAKNIGSIDGTTVTVGSMPVAMYDLGEGVSMVVETNEANYKIRANVYTMVIDTAEELDTWQVVAAQNAIDAGLVIEAQKGLVYSGYFVLGADIEYNKVWTTYKNFGQLWALCYNNVNIWKNPDEYRSATAPTADQMVDGAIVEDWGAGRLAGFQGTFDGDGHYIHGLQIANEYSAFIVTMGIGGIIKDVAFTGAKIATNTGLVANRGQGTFENIFVEVASMESGMGRDNCTHVVIKSSTVAQRYYNNIVVDLSKIDFANLKYAYVIDMSASSANGVYVLGAEDALFTRGVNGWTAGSDETGSWDKSQACVFWYFLEGDDVGGSYAKASDLAWDIMFCGTDWDSDFWWITDNVIIAKSVIDIYDAPMEITNEETAINTGTSLVATANVNKAYVVWTLKEDVAGVSINGDVISVAEYVAVGTEFTIVVTSLLDANNTTEMTFTVAPKIVVLTDEITFETYNNTTISLPAGVEGTINKVIVGAHVVYDRENGVGRVSGRTVTVGSMPVAMSDLGDGVAMTIATDKATYYLTANVYTMIIDTAEELEQFYNVAAQNALDAGLVIEAQKGFVHSGYFVLGADIEYNKVWTPYKSYMQLWALCYNNVNIWKDPSQFQMGRAPTADQMVDGAIVEDWGAGNLGGFQGTFDGKGYAIKGLELKGDYAGFIGTMGKNGVLKNIAFTDVKLGTSTGIVERGGKDGSVIENVYVEIDSIASGKDAGSPTKVMTQHGKTTLKNVVVNVTECDFTGVEYVYLLNSTYNTSENVYVIHRGKIADTKTDFTTNGTGATAFWYFNASVDKGACFATVADLLADEVHGAIVATMGGYWSVIDGKFYFGDEEIKTAAEKVFIEKEFISNVDNQVVLENEALTVGSEWTVDINGAISTVTVEEKGKVTLFVDPATIDGYKVVVALQNQSKEIIFDNVIAVTYISTVEELRAIGMGENNITATDNLKGYYALAQDITFTHYDDKTDVIAAGYHKAGGPNYQHLWAFQGVFDGNGYTIDNMRVSDGGMFGFMEKATVKNLKLTNVHIVDSVPDTVSKQRGGYVAILAYTAPQTTFENISITIKSSPASAWTWKRDGLLVVTGAAGASTFRNITVDASYVELKTLLGVSYNADNVYENVVIKAANYCAIGYTADSYGAGGVQNVAALMTEFPAGITFEKVAKAEIPNNPMNTNYVKLDVYEGDVTALGFAEGDYVFAVENTDLWNSRILFPVDPANYDYVEFDVVLTKDIVSFLGWPSNGNNTQGSMSIYGAQMDGKDGCLDRVIQVFDKNGNTFEQQYRGGFKANTFYTIRVNFTKGDDMKYLHFGTGTLQTYYVSNARWGKVGVENDVYTYADGKLLPKYTGDVTALGYAEGSTVTQVAITDGWSSRVRVDANTRYDYVDVQVSFTGDRKVGSFCLWMYGINSSVLQGNYTVTTAGGVAANSASERTIQVLNVDGSAVTETGFEANKVYTLRIYLNGDAASIAISTFDTNAESTALLNFGAITFGNNA